MAETWRVIDQGKSLTFSVMAEVPNGDEMELMTGRFPEWAATIDFDFEDPEAASVEVEIDIAEAVLRPISLRSQLLGPKWFDVDRHPKAIFRSKSVQVTDAGYNIAGTLTLKGTTAAVALEIRVAPSSGDVVVVQGTGEIDRVEWNIGRSFPSSVVERQVAISFKFRATR